MDTTGWHVESTRPQPYRKKPKPLKNARSGKNGRPQGRLANWLSNTKLQSNTTCNIVETVLKYTLYYTVQTKQVMFRNI